MKKLRIALSSSLPDRAATVSIWVDGTQVDNIAPVQELVVLEYDLTESNPHTLRIKMENDYNVAPDDLNLIINYLQISDENGVFPTYDYLIPDAAMNNRLEDNSGLVLTTLWGTPMEFDMEIDENNLIIWHDYYQEDLDNPPPAP